MKKEQVVYNEKRSTNLPEKEEAKTNYTFVIILIITAWVSLWLLMIFIVASESRKVKDSQINNDEQYETIKS